MSSRPVVAACCLLAVFHPGGTTTALGQTDPNAAVSLADDAGSTPEEAFTETDRTAPPPREFLPTVAPPRPAASLLNRGGLIEPPVAARPGVRSLPAAGTESGVEGALVAEQREVIAVDEFENEENTFAPFGGDFFGPALDFLSPTDPSGRDSFLITFGANVGYDTNVVFTPDPIASGTATANLGFRFLGRLPRLETDVALNTAVTMFENRPGGDRQNSFSLVGGAVYTFRPRVTLDLLTTNTYSAEPDPEIQGGTFQASNGSYLVSNTSFNVSFQLRPRFSLVFGYTYNSLQYDDEVINDQSGFVSQTLSLTSNYLLSPRTTLLGVIRYNGVSYAQDGQGSDGIILLAGLTESFSSRFETTLRAGAEFRRLRNPDTTIPDLTSEYLGPFVEGELSYSYAPQSTILGTLRYGTEPTGVSGFIIRQTLRMSLSDNHRFGEKLSSQLALSYESSFFDQPGDVADYSQSISTVSAVLRYQFNPTIAAVVTGNFLIFESELPDSNYDRGFVSFGFDLSL